ncbi:MAG: carbohydrate-binding domain-containing protein, partial [Clostridia bacterium]|nr:carbohydrate-binding domain-containing protein [Clostridia bacterium]
MKRLYRWIAMLLITITLCPTATIGKAESVELPQLDDYFTLRDLTGDWDATATLISLEGDTAVTASHVVSVEGGVVTILDGGVYVLSGTLEDGQIVVDVKDDEKVQLVLNGASITSSNSAAIVIRQADKLFITLAEGTQNTLSNGGSFEEEGIDAVIWSDEDLTFNGTGTLAIESPAGDGIDGNDDIKFVSGAYAITAAGRGVDSNDSIRIADGDFTVTTDGTAFRASHTSNDELGYIYIWGGSFKITTGDGAGEFTIQGEAMGGPQGMPNF